MLGILATILFAQHIVTVKMMLSSPELSNPRLVITATVVTCYGLLFSAIYTWWDRINNRHIADKLAHSKRNEFQELTSITRDVNNMCRFKSTCPIVERCDPFSKDCLLSK